MLGAPCTVRLKLNKSEQVSGGGGGEEPVQ